VNRRNPTCASKTAAKLLRVIWRKVAFDRELSLLDREIGDTPARRRRVIPPHTLQQIRHASEPSIAIKAIRSIIAVLFAYFIALICAIYLSNKDATGLPILTACAVFMSVALVLAWRFSSKICAILQGSPSRIAANVFAVAFGSLSALVAMALEATAWGSIPVVIALTAVGVLLFHREPLASALYVASLGLGHALTSDPTLDFSIAIAIATVATFGIAQSYSKLLTQTMSETKSAIARAKAAEAVLESFERSGDNWFWEIDRAGEVTYASPKFCDFLGISADDIVGQCLVSTLKQHTRLPSHASGIDSLTFYLAANLPFHDIIIQINKHGHDRWMSLSGGAIVDDLKQVSGHSGIGIDISAIREAENRAKNLAHFDSLTGLANRAYFHDLLGGLVAKSVREHAPCSLFFIDLDRFKIVNDTLGHSVGDELLRTVAYRIDKVVGGRGQAGRLGGDEFVVVLPNISNADELGSTADRLIAELSAPYFIGPSQVLIGASVGIATSPHDGASADELLSHADLALYASKEGGRGTFRFYDATMRSSAETRRTLEMDLREALSRGELHVLYQPILDLHNQRLAGFEALLRWDHPVKGSVSPDQFVPIAEESALILQLGEWVLRTALAEASHWPEPLTIAINISPVQLQDTGFASVVMSALANSQIDAKRVELEITESVFLHETPATSQNLAQIQSLGVRLSLDDFGTGYSSLGYLRKATFNKIKIDRSFVQGIDVRNNNNEAIIKAVVALAKSYGIITTAEGAETAGEVQALHDLGCDQVQGFAFGHPMQCYEASLLCQEEEKSFKKLVHAPREARLLMIKTIEITIQGRSFLAVLRNVSCGGAMIETEADLNLGDVVDLNLPSYGKARGTICWIDNRRAGISFDEDIQIRELDRLRADFDGMHEAVA
jgi:diguanylate cyclase (GGDEF)-like protein/PAS domain S-box-containing protein